MHGPHLLVHHEVAIDVIQEDAKQALAVFSPDISGKGRHYLIIRQPLEVAPQRHLALCRESQCVLLDSCRNGGLVPTA